MEYTQVKNPVWADAEHTAINCEVNFTAVPEEFSPFTANPQDTYPWSAQIFNECVAGNYGPVAEYVPPPPYVPSAEANKQEAVQRLAATDWVNQPDVTNPDINPHLLNHADYITYRSQIRAIAINPTAGNLDWPTEPTPEWSQA